MNNNNNNIKKDKTAGWLGGMVGSVLSADGGGYKIHTPFTREKKTYSLSRRHEFFEMSSHAFSTHTHIHIA